MVLVYKMKNKSIFLIDMQGLKKVKVDIKKDLD